MTNKQLARKEYIGQSTLLHFLEMGWVDRPKVVENWTEDEAMVAHVQIRTTIAYQRGWIAGKRNLPIDSRVHSFAD